MCARIGRKCSNSWVGLHAVALLALSALLAAALRPPASRAAAQEPQHAAVLIVEYGDGRTDALCVSFAEESISGAELLLRSGLEVGLEPGGLGVQVCEIDGVGCKVGREPCFCQCKGSTCAYWSYFQWQGGQWLYSPVGASQRMLKDGDADAWVWGDGKQLPSRSPEGICAPSPATPSGAAQATLPATPTHVPATTSTPQPPQPPAGGPRLGLCGSAALVPAALGLVLSGLWFRERS
jgi:hypothetical protein